jgi:tartrate dehydrogenase/decarboxylase/D-malate dehydrogenase
MLDHFGHLEAGAAIVRAIERVLEAGPAHAPFTPDIGGKAGTGDLGKAIVEAL